MDNISKIDNVIVREKKKDKIRNEDYALKNSESHLRR